MVAVAHASKEFAEDGRLTNERYLTALTKVMAELRRLIETQR